MLTVYIIRSIQDPTKHYVGITQDLQKRLAYHNSSAGGYAKHFSPWNIETYVVFQNDDLARRFERYLKKGSGHSFLRRRLI